MATKFEVVDDSVREQVVASTGRPAGVVSSAVLRALLDGKTVKMPVSRKTDAMSGYLYTAAKRHGKQLRRGTLRDAGNVAVARVMWLEAPAAPAKKK